MAVTLETLSAEKKKLDAFRPFSKEILTNLEKWFEVELTYSSNAIEGNTLTRQETALVLEKGLTVGGKPLKDHLEAINHLEAIQAMKEMTKKSSVSLETADKIIIKTLNVIIKPVLNCFSSSRKLINFTQGIDDWRKHKRSV